MSWIADVIRATEENESPERFFYWSALAAIAAAARKNVYLDRFYYRLYPNLYVFLVARSGMKKGVPVNVIKGLIKRVACTRVITGRNSVQHVLQDLSKAYSVEGGGIIKDAHGFLVSGELAAFLVRDQDALTILTDLHDTHAYEDEWKNSLKGTGVDTLKSPCLTLLGATNEEHFPDAVPANAIGGGFIARTFIVFEDRRKLINPLVDKPQTTLDFKALSEHLIEVSKVKGEFKYTPDAKELYRKWYTGHATEDHRDPTGTMERLGDQVLKAAMCISLGNQLDLVLTKDFIQEAIDVSTACVAGVRQVTMGQGAAQLARATRLVLRELIARDPHEIKRSKLLQKFWGEFDALDLDRIIETLSATGAIDVSHFGKEVTYYLKEETLNMYTKFRRQIQ